MKRRDPQDPSGPLEVSCMYGAPDAEAGWNRSRTVGGVDGWSEDRWTQLEGGYRVRYDPRPTLARLASGEASAWDELWQELYHQGDVGTASYASVPELTVLERERVTPEWNTYALVASIELARLFGSNPPIPDWLEHDYHRALASLAADATTKLPAAATDEAVRSMLSVIAISKRLRRHAILLLDFSDEELQGLLGEVFDNG